MLVPPLVEVRQCRNIPIFETKALCIYFEYYLQHTVGNECGTSIQIQIQKKIRSRVELNNSHHKSLEQRKQQANWDICGMKAMKWSIYPFLNIVSMTRPLNTATLHHVSSTVNLVFLSWKISIFIRPSQELMNVC